MKRIFHPIGQGAFYVEKHADFNFVYDCGAFPKRKSAQQIVKNAFKKKEDKIDLLCISHFDDDHINLIEILKNNFTIKKVCMPLMGDKEIRLIKNVHIALGLKVDTNLYSNPESYFNSPETEIIKIKVFNPEDKEHSNSKEEIIDFKELKGEIESGTKINIKASSQEKDYWRYIPFNFCQKERKAQFQNELKKRNININQIRELEYVILHKKAIRNAYEAVDGNINANSLVVLSVPATKKSWAIYRNKFMTYWHFSEHILEKNFGHPDCLYLGDSDGNNYGDLVKTVPDEIKKISTVQIPHHGSIKSFNNDIAKGGRICVISHGEHNSYGHPSADVIADILCCGGVPIQVTENTSSIYVECFT